MKHGYGIVLTAVIMAILMIGFGGALLCMQNMNITFVSSLPVKVDHLPNCIFQEVKLKGLFPGV